MTEPAKETVIIVHGTWAAPKLGASQWYQPVDGAPAVQGFISKLDAALQERGSPARCWAHCAGGIPIFQWSGKNCWIARTQAASSLGDYVAKLRKEGWRYHIIAHSHGGNVMVEALPQITTLGSDGPCCKLVSLGTPFIDTTMPILHRIKRRNRIINVVLWITFIVLIGSLFSALLNRVEPLGAAAAATFTFLVLLIALFLVGIVRRRKTRSSERRDVWGTDTDQTLPQLLVISTPVDEAWQLLYHMREAVNPLAIASNPLTYLTSSLRSAFAQSASVARIYGARSYRDLGTGAKFTLAITHLYCLLLLFGWIKALLDHPTTSSGQVFIMSIVALTLALIPIATITPFLGESFFSASISPLRWCARLIGCLGYIGPAMFTYALRYFSWSVLLKMVMGLEDYRFGIPPIEQQHPSPVPKNFVKYEDMPKGAQQRALDKRSAWIARHLGDISQTFSKLAITATDVTLLLRTVEADQTLVHAAYYTDDDCISRIADWIAGRG